MRSSRLSPSHRTTLKSLLEPSRSRSYVAIDAALGFFCACCSADHSSIPRGSPLPKRCCSTGWSVTRVVIHSKNWRDNCSLVQQRFARPICPSYCAFFLSRGNERVATFLAAWMETYRSDEEAWWLLLEEALENRATDPITQLGPIETWPQPYTYWQWILLARMATIAPEPTCWILLQKIVRALSSFPHPSARQLFVERIVAHLEHDDPRAQLIAALLSRYVGVHAIDPPLQVLFRSGSRIARALAAGLLIPGRPDRTDPAAFSKALSDLMSLLTESDEQASLVRTLLPELNPMAIAEYALCSEIPSWHRQALRLLELCGATAAELSALATRLDLAGFHVSAGSVLRLAAKFAHQQGDRTTLLSVLHQLIRVDPGEDAAIDFVINTKTRAGRTSRAIDTLIAAATRAHDRGAIARSVALLERAQTLAEMSDDRPRLALAAELLATTDEGSAERHVAAATALLRAGHLDRA